MSETGTVEKMMKRIRAEIERGRAGHVEPEAELPTYVAVPLQPVFVPSPDGRYRLDDLLAYHDEAFVRAGFLSVLRREPDPEGNRHFLELLRSGTSKVEILGRLRNSEEGRSVGTHVEGLRSRFLLHRTYRIPVVGRGLRILSALFQLPRIMQNQRIFEAHAMNLLGQMQDAAVAGNARTQDRVHAVAQSLQTLNASVTSTLATNSAAWASVLRNKVDAAEVEALTRKLHALTVELADHAARSDLQDEADRREVKELASHLDLALSDLAARMGEQIEARSLRTEVDPLRHEMVELFSLIRIARTEAREGLEAAIVPVRQMAEQKASATALDDLRATVAQQAGENGARLAALGTQHEKLVGLIESARVQARRELAITIDPLRRMMQQRRTLPAREEVRPELRRIADDAIASPGEGDHLLDVMYAMLEDRFRGTRAEIKQRQSVYLPYIAAANAGTSGAPVVDLGCGRGEWLEVLRDHGLVGIGVDINQIFLNACSELKLDVVERDAILHLQGLEPGSVGAITSFHLIEHLPTRGVIALLDEALRVLRPGGVLVFETPNPANLIVGACNFYVDPTHRNPIPAQLGQFLVEARGFSDVRVLPLHPVDPEWLKGRTDPASLTINHFMYGPQDYGVIGRKA